MIFKHFQSGNLPPIIRQRDTNSQHKIVPSKIFVNIFRLIWTNQFRSRSLKILHFFLSIKFELKMKNRPFVRRIWWSKWQKISSKLHRFGRSLLWNALAFYLFTLLSPPICDRLELATFVLLAWVISENKTSR